ncbi:hypothetical protein PTTG_01281 [Puccinia triticina 1-1 BBBD Race 1]|uniref:Uncharacterized protein n=1 Tax=Puccinia triticina (isolate 1-1 / race 1 (BBBD)) TaxID=630390 RepID=A0A180GXJ7_PUCT1|nr:hypothetical protein PTTG_01281 [Puccinia triticina 1-1 BBBD Race 1]
MHIQHWVGSPAPPPREHLGRLPRFPAPKSYQHVLEQGMIACHRRRAAPAGAGRSLCTLGSSWCTGGHVPQDATNLALHHCSHSPPSGDSTQAPAQLCPSRCTSQPPQTAAGPVPPRILLTDIDPSNNTLRFDDPVVSTMIQRLYPNLGVQPVNEDPLTHYKLVDAPRRPEGPSPIWDVPPSGHLDRDNCTCPTVDEVNIQVGLMA